jgi:hypothetical protein
VLGLSAVSELVGLVLVDELGEGVLLVLSLATTALALGGLTGPVDHGVGVSISAQAAD